MFPVLISDSNTTDSNIANISGYVLVQFDIHKASYHAIYQNNVLLLVEMVKRPHRDSVKTNELTSQSTNQVTK
jgi:hypothetical protein